MCRCVTPAGEHCQLQSDWVAATTAGFENCAIIVRLRTDITVARFEPAIRNRHSCEQRDALPVPQLLSNVEQVATELSTLYHGIVALQNVPIILSRIASGNLIELLVPFHP